MHARRYFLEKIRAKLDALPDFTSVKIQRIGPSSAAFPCVTLCSANEQVETLLIHPHPRVQNRVLTVSVSAWIRGTVDGEKAESDMDDFALVIESAMTSPTNADDIILVATDFAVDETEPEIHVVTLTYYLHYNNVEFTPIIV